MVHPAEPLPPVAAHVDRELAALSRIIDWLHYLSPLHNDEMWRYFRESDYTDVPAFVYPELDFDPEQVRARLLGLSVTDIEHPALEALLVEKQHELDRQLELIRLRQTGGLHPISTDLFGSPTPSLLSLAHEVLQKVPVGPEQRCDTTCEQVLAEANRQVQAYHAEADDFDAEVIIDEDLNSLLMVQNGNLHIAASIAIPRARLAGLLAHEIGTHMVTYYNGRHQPLLQLSSGLAHYDELQEGLGVFSEYLAGQLSAERLRVLAARVIAAEHALSERAVPEIYHCLHEEHRLPPVQAFDTAVRACRGGGLTKDIVYLRGLSELLAYLSQGGDLETLFRGKFALSQLHTLEGLEKEGYILPSRMVPFHLRSKEAARRLAKARTIPLTELFQPSQEAA